MLFHTAPAKIKSTLYLVFLDHGLTVGTNLLPFLSGFFQFTGHLRQFAFCLLLMQKEYIMCADFNFCVVQDLNFNCKHPEDSNKRRTHNDTKS